MKNLAWLGALYLTEILVFSTWLDGGVLVGRTGIPGQIGAWGAWVLRGLVGFVAAFGAFAGLSGQISFKELIQSGGGKPRWRFLYAHIACILVFGVLSGSLYRGLWDLGSPNVIALGWLLSGAAAAATAAAAFTTAALWDLLFRRTRAAWISAAVVTLAAVSFVRASQSLWTVTAQLTFRLVRLILSPVFPDLTANPQTLLIRTVEFGVVIDQNCSGLEGAGLMLAFSIGWLLLYRRDFKFPRSLLLVPAGILILYLLNAFRIAALLIIGHLGATQIAAGGFHSQAGWIAFNGVALAMTVVVPRIQWFSTRPLDERKSSENAEPNPTAPFLLPFLAILGAGMISRAASAEFEWLYPIRFAAALVTLWVYRRQLRKLRWSLGWRGVAAGVAVFAVWVGLDAWEGRAAEYMPEALVDAATPLSVLWISVRALAATLTVPLAEELAFRGFLMRQFGPVAFDELSFHKVTWAGVVLSSVCFGVLHGDRWMAGILAGAIYAWAAKKSGGLGDAVLGHSITNGLLAFEVIALGQWQYW